MAANSIENQVAEAIAALDRVRRKWQSRQGVTGLDVGLLWHGGTMSQEVGIRVKVSKKLPPEDVPSGELFPDHVGTIRVQVLEEGAPAPQADSETAAGESWPANHGDSNAG